MLKKAQKSDITALKRKLEERSEELLREFEEKHSDVLEYLERSGINLDHVVQKGSRKAVAGLAAGVVLLSSGVVPHKEQTPVTESPLLINKIVGEAVGKQDTRAALLKTFAEHLPRNLNNLSLDDEKILAEDVSKISGVVATPELEGNRLNTAYGRIGLEQHLPRYPGDNIHDHFESGISSSIYGKSGMTRNKGAFGYFAPNKFALTKEDIEKEKYYVVVQTFDIPGYNSSKANWYKHRKVVVVNTENGKAVVGVIADSGPAKWTGKSFGGSPELMDHLEMYRGSRKAKVLVFFVDEQNGEVRLGPI